MARFITLKRKYLLYGVLIILVAFGGYLGVNYLTSSQASSTAEKVEPQLKFLNVDFNPKIVLKDIKYEGEAYKGLQTIPSNQFNVSAVIQNMTAETMSNIPVKLSISLVDDKSKNVSKLGNIPSLEPGTTAKIAFENITALGDSKGEKLSGQHEMVLAILANPAGGVSQSTEAKIVFNVDSTIK